MAKLTLNDLENLNNQSSVISLVNDNSARTEVALENTLSRDGTTPNTMEADLDMNSNRILNLPDPSDPTEPVRLMDLEAFGDTGFYVGDILDVDLTEPVADNDFLRYDLATDKWVNESVLSLGGAPDTADYLVKTANASLSAERAVTDTLSVVWDWSTAGQAKATRAALTGDVTAGANANTTTIAADAVTFAKMQDVATDSLLGRDTAGTGDVESITLNATLSMDGSNHLQRAALTGDVTATAGSNTTAIANNAVTLAKMNDLATARVIGRVTAGTGDPEALTGAQVGGLISVANLSDVDVTGLTTGDTLEWNGSNWINAASGGGGSPATEDYLVKTASGSLSAERVVGDSASITWDWATPGAVTANVVGSALDSDIVALGNNSTNGLWARTGSGTGAARTLTQGTGITITNGDGVSGNPTISVSGASTGDPELDAIAGLTSAADKGIQFTGSGTAATYDLTTAGKALLDDASASAQRTTLGVGTGDSPEFTAVNVGHASDTTITRSAAGVIAVEGVPIYSNIPANSQSTAYSTVLGDMGKFVLHPTADNNARTFTIDGSVSYQVGTAITFVNQINTLTIDISTDTLTWAQDGTTTSRTLAPYGIATALKVASGQWIISGTGLT